MRAQIVPANYGRRWLTDGWKIFRASPGRWLTLVATYFLAMKVIGVIPFFVGAGFVTILIPGVSVGFMAASRIAERGQSIELNVLLSGFRERIRAQLILGGVYLIAIVLLLGATTLVDDGVLARMVLLGEMPSKEILKSGGLLGSLSLAAALYAPLAMLFWFAPTLVAWHSMPVPKAFFFSFLACLTNWRAFTIYGIATAFLLIVLTNISALVLALISGGKLGLDTIMFIVGVFVTPALFASFYASYRDIFTHEDLPQPE